jgi:hypothetical protein
MTASPDLVLVGNLLVDDIVLAGGRTLLGEPGGAVLHAALAASLWNCRVGIVSVVGTDYPETTLVTLAGRQIDLARSFGDRSDRPFLSLDPFELLQDENARRWREPLAMIDGFFAGEDDLRISGDAKAIVRELAGGPPGRGPGDDAGHPRSAVSAWPAGGCGPRAGRPRAWGRACDDRDPPRCGADRPLPRRTRRTGDRRRRQGQSRPFLLERMRVLTGDASLAANEALLVHNARTAAQIAVALEACR